MDPRTIPKKLSANLKKINENIATAAERRGRRADAVTTVAVTKTVATEVIRHLVELGQVHLGESRVQELIRRASMINEFVQRHHQHSSAVDSLVPQKLHWHMVGHLQRNKVKSAIQHADLIHSVDSLRLAEELQKTAGELGKRPKVLLQINCSQEKQKHGVPVPAATHMAEQVMTMKNLELIGMMTMTPRVDDPQSVRPLYARARELFEEIRRIRDIGERFAVLSMGMSQDYTVAVEEGATMVRVGTALFDGMPTNTEPTPTA